MPERDPRTEPSCGPTDAGRRQALVRRIRAAFAAVPRPAPSAITPHRCGECDELRDHFAPYTAESLPRELLDRHVWDLPLLSAEAKQYFLPAWLCTSLADPTWPHADAAMQDIDGGERYDPPGGYTDEQWRAMIDWLDLQQAEDPPGPR